MPNMLYPAQLVLDFATGLPITERRDKVGQVVQRGNPSVVPDIFSDEAGTILIPNGERSSTAEGMVAPFWIDEDFGPVSWLSGGVEYTLQSVEGIAKQQDALAARVEALETSGVGGGVDDDGMGDLIADDESATRAALTALYGPGTLFLEVDEEVPPGTPAGTMIVRTGAGGGGTDPVPTTFASDLFERTEATGWGNADTGGPWTNISSAKTSVSSGAGRAQTVASETQGGMVQGFSQADTETHAVVSQGATSGARVVRIHARRQSSSDYHQLSIRQYGASHASSPGRVDVSFDESSYTTGVLTGVAADQKIHIKFRLTGSAPTTLQAKVWLDGTPEPAGWTSSTTKGTGPQTAGYGGIYFYSTGSEPGTAQHAVHEFTVKGA